MTFTEVACTAAAIVATGIGLAATAHAEPDYQQFTSPSGNVKCEMTISYKGDPYANCVVRQAAYAAPAGTSDFPGAVNPQFSLGQGDTPKVSCVVASDDKPAEFTLDFGQTRSVGTITCDSEETGVTCTDTATYHFFRISPESHDLG
jgi:hypothetical protein